MNWFVKRQWSKWEHVGYFESYYMAKTTYELFISTCELTGITRYKKVFVGSSSHDLEIMIKNWYKQTKQNHEIQS